MVLIEDTRNQIGKHKNVRAYCEKNGIQIVRSKLVVGDYALPADQRTVVDTKLGLTEVYSNLVQDHDRFRRECVLAQQLGIKLVVLVEEASIHSVYDVQFWKNPRVKAYNDLKLAHSKGKMLDRKLAKNPPLESKRLMVMMAAMSERYGVEWEFCSKFDTGKRIVELLGGDR